jgi:hypothetical protein
MSQKPRFERWISAGFVNTRKYQETDTQITYPRSLKGDADNRCLAAMSTLNYQKLEKLRQMLAPHSTHLGIILNGSVASFSEISNPLRFSNTANGLRELLRELFAAISPDGSIRTSSWFTPDPTSKTGVTRRNRIVFAVYSYLDPQYFPKDFSSRIDTLATQIVKQVDLLSSLTHVSKESLATSTESAIECFDTTIYLFLSLFESIDTAREHLRDALQIELIERISDIFSSDFFDKLDILSSHTRPQYAEDVDVVIDEISVETISFSGTGSVLCDLQYGSDGDCARGDGLEISDSYPFTFSGEALTSNPRKVRVDHSNIDVDTSSFYE